MPTTVSNAACRARPDVIDEEKFSVLLGIERVDICLARRRGRSCLQRRPWRTLPSPSGRHKKVTVPKHTPARP